MRTMLKEEYIAMKHSLRPITMIAFILLGTGIVLGFSYYDALISAPGSGLIPPSGGAAPSYALNQITPDIPDTAAVESDGTYVMNTDAAAAEADSDSTEDAAAPEAGSEPAEDTDRTPYIASDIRRPYQSLLGAALSIEAPEVQAGEDLWATAAVSGASGRFLCEVDWFYDGVPMEGNCGGYLVVTDGASMTAGADIEFSEDMPLEHTIGLMLSYTDPATGHTERLYRQTTVTINNYSRAYYVRKQNEEAIRSASSASEVSCVYRGSYSSSYDVDYSEEVKTAFINEGGYASETGWLVWVNLATQKVNIFEGSQGNWQLARTYRCATGAPDTPTPTGVTYTTYKQTGWVTDEYQVKYVTRFYPGSGYAFHSILYTPDGSSVLSGAMGYPKSHGCVRTEDEGVRWIYDNLPTHSTVVIY